MAKLRDRKSYTVWQNPGRYGKQINEIYSFLQYWLPKSTPKSNWIFPLITFIRIDRFFPLSQRNSLKHSKILLHFQIKRSLSLFSVPPVHIALCIAKKAYGTGNALSNFNFNYEPDIELYTMFVIMKARPAYKKGKEKKGWL